MASARSRNGIPWEGNAPQKRPPPFANRSAEAISKPRDFREATLPLASHRRFIEFANRVRKTDSRTWWSARSFLARHLSNAAPLPPGEANRNQVSSLFQAKLDHEYLLVKKLIPLLPCEEDGFVPPLTGTPPGTHHARDTPGEMPISCCLFRAAPGSLRRV